MSCGHCAARVEKGLRAVNGVIDVKVDLASGTAVVSGTVPDEAALKEAVERSGYRVAAISGE